MPQESIIKGGKETKKARIIKGGEWTKKAHIIKEGKVTKRPHITDLPWGFLTRATTPETNIKKHISKFMVRLAAYHTTTVVSCPHKHQIYKCNEKPEEHPHTTFMNTRGH